jgi:hypothetical protein
MSTLDEITKEKQRISEALARVDMQREKLASCECYEGCSSGVGLGNCWLPTIGNPNRSPE